jgi:hypothetical protein
MAKSTSRNQGADPHKSDPRDRCYTPAYALDPLLPYLPPGAVVWESAAGDGHLVRALESAGRTVYASELTQGHNFYTHAPPVSWGVQVTNPPYSTKYQWIEHSYRLGRPWALLMPLETLGAWSAQRHFRAHGVEVLVLNKRVNFYMPNMGLDGGGANFPVAWFCWKLLPAPMVWGEIVPRADSQATFFREAA